jgi:hypothetical protein
MALMLQQVSSADSIWLVLCVRKEVHDLLVPVC